MITYKVEITINDETIGIAGEKRSHFKNDENAIKAVKKDIDRFLKSQIENRSIFDQD